MSCGTCSPDDLLVAGAAGHSLGEYTALAAAGAFSFEAGLALVAARGRAMAGAAEAQEGSMAALVGADRDKAEDLASSRRSEGGLLWVANLNATSQVVIAGAEVDVNWASEHAREFGIRRVIPLNVAGAFHTPMMSPAQRGTRRGAQRDGFWRDAVSRLVERLGVTCPRHPNLAEGSANPRGALLGHTRRHGPKTDLFLHVGPGDVTARHGKTNRSLGQVPGVQ